MTAETKLPEGLQLAVDLIEAYSWQLDEASEDEPDQAEIAIRAEHTQRLALQQRVAGLEAERDTLRARLAELEGQEPVAHYRKSDAAWLQSGNCTTVYRHAAEDWTEPLYARPVPAITAGWKPIESAPKNGTAVLSLLAGSDVAHSVRWLESGHKFANGTAGWHIVWDLSRVSLQDGPDYWMPIPTAPEAAR
jgi:hypothetical protein